MTVADLRERAVAAGVPLATLVAEALHVILLDALFAHPESQVMAFQGGTCLHLVHGGYRFSEDLDLAGRDLDATAARSVVARARVEVERLSVQLLGPGGHTWKAPVRSGRVATYWFHFTPEALGQRIRIKIEFAHFPTYQAAVLPVRSELDLLHRQPLITALQPAELLAQKVTAVLGRRYLKGRDLFDLWYLDVVLQAALDPEIFKHKIADYAVHTESVAVRARMTAVETADIGAEMDRFLPGRYRRQLGQDGYEAVRAAALSVLERAAKVAERW